MRRIRRRGGTCVRTSAGPANSTWTWTTALHFGRCCTTRVSRRRRRGEAGALGRGGHGFVRLRCAESRIGVMAMMCPQAPSLVRRIHAVERHKAGRDRGQREKLLPTHMPEIEGYDPIGMRPDVRHVVAGLNGGCRDVTGQEQQPSEPEDAVNEGGGTLV